MATINRESLDAVVCGIFRRLGLEMDLISPEPGDFLHDDVIVASDPDGEYIEPLEAVYQVPIASSVLIPAVIAAIENPLNVDLGPVKAALAKARKEIARLRSSRESKSKPRAAA